MLFLEISFTPAAIRVPLFVIGLVLAFTGVHWINSLQEEDSPGSGQVVSTVEFSGLEWLNTGDSLPTKGRQLDNLALASALTLGGKATVAVLQAHLAADPASRCIQELSQVFFLRRMCSLCVECFL